MLSLFAATESTKLYSYDVPWFMYAMVVGALIGYALIEAHHTKKDHVIQFKEAVKWSVFYVSLALLFTIPVFMFIGSQAAGEYLAGWAIEKALSLDNLFVIGLILTSFKVSPLLERRMLNYGVAGAIFFRLIFIIAGTALLKKFEWVSIFFGLILLHAAWKAFQEARGGGKREEKVEITEKWLWKTIVRILPVYPKFVGNKMIIIKDGKRMLTMMAAVVLLIELTDIMFAIDSVPAVLAVSPDRFIAYSSNVFALLGLRALFFVYRSVAVKFWALNWALAGILVWIGFKMIATPLGFHVKIGVSLAILFTLLVGSVIVSLSWPREIEEHPIHIAD